MHRAIAPTRLLTACVLLFALPTVAQEAFAAGGVDHAACRSYDMASRMTVHSQPIPYAIVDDEAAEMRQMAAGFQADARSRFGLSGSAKTFCDLFPGRSEAQAFLAKDIRQAADSNMTVRQSDWSGDGEGVENALEIMKLRAIGAAVDERQAKARAPRPGSHVLPAHAKLLAAPGKRWRVVSEQDRHIEVIGLDPAQAGSRQPTAVVATYRLRNEEVHIREGSVYADYSLALMSFDCGTHGKEKVLATYFHSLEQGLMASDTRERDWSVALELFGASGRWKLACGQGAKDEAFAAEPSHDETVRAYRQRVADQERRADEELIAGDLARRSGDIVPQTSLAAATASSHWHVSAGNRLWLSAVAAHGVTEGSAPARKRMSTALFFDKMRPPPRIPGRPAEVGFVDFFVQDLEFDCATPSRIRRLGYAMYVIVNGELKVLTSAKTPEEWKTLPEQHPDAKAWVWACKGGPETDSFAPGMSFEAMLKTYRELLNAPGGLDG